MNKNNSKQIEQAFIKFLKDKSGAKTDKELQDYIKTLGKEGLKKA
jgi:Ca2+-binding EF-hand superfamily protein